jgi:DNA-binding transcriptional ArsR family regulator
MKENSNIEIRDLRRKEYFQVDDAYLNGYARKCGIYATGVYIALCRHVNSVNQSCFPSINLIAKKLAISKSQVIRALKKLEELNLIKKEKVEGKNNYYSLLDKKHWKTSVCETPVPDRHQNPTDTSVYQAPTSVYQAPTSVYQTPTSVCGTP